MTTQEFKERRPDLKHLEGDALWDAMTNYMLQHQQVDESLKVILPFFKRYQLRWLFYRKSGWGMIRSENNYKSNNRCAKCKGGCDGYHLVLMDFASRKIAAYCPHCSEPLVKEPNASFKHTAYVAWKWVSKQTELALDWLHILRKKNEDRYGMFGDENRYVSKWSMDLSKGTSKAHFRSRKWWEYIFIERKTFKI